MLYYDGTDISEEIDSTKSNRSKKCVICHYWFYNHGLKSQDSACSGHHDLTILCLNIANIAIITVKDIDYRYIIHSISKSEAINFSKNLVLDDRGYI